MKEAGGPLSSYIWMADGHGASAANFVPSASTLFNLGAVDLGASAVNPAAALDMTLASVDRLAVDGPAPSTAWRNASFDHDSYPSHTVVMAADVPPSTTEQANCIAVQAFTFCGAARLSEGHEVSFAGNDPALVVTPVYPGDGTAYGCYTSDVCARGTYEVTVTLADFTQVVPVDVIHAAASVATST